MVPLKESQLATIQAKNGLDYHLTLEDVMWAARMAVYEGGESAADLLWCYTQRYAYISKKTREKSYPCFHNLLTAHSQPINPKWRRDGEFCKVGGKYHENNKRCSDSQLNRRDEAYTVSWEKLEAKHPDRTKAVLEWAQGFLPNPVFKAVDFAAPGVAAGFLKKNTDSQLLKKAGNWFIGVGKSLKWDNNYVTMVASDGSPVDQCPAEPPSQESPANDKSTSSIDDLIHGIAAVASPVLINSKKDWSDGIASSLFESTEKKTIGGYYPIGASSVWHGGVHIELSEGECMHAPFAGMIVAARLGGGNSHSYGSRNFILIEHVLSGDELSCIKTNAEKKNSFQKDKTYPFYSLYMHLDTNTIDPGSEQIQKVRWLSLDDPTRNMTGSVGKNGNNIKQDVGLVQEKLKACNLYNGEIDQKCGKYTIGAIASFQSGFMKKPDSRIDPGGETWEKLLEKEKELTGGGVCKEIVDKLNSGNIVKLQIPIYAGDTVWAVGSFLSNKTEKTIIHWEIFSADNLMPSWKLAEDLDDDFSLNCSSITSKIEQNSWFFDKDVLDIDEVRNFYQNNPESESLRKYVCRFHSEWAVNPDTAVLKLKGHFNIDGLAERLKPYMWWNEAKGAGVPLPSSPKVYHYNPISFCSEVQTLFESELPSSSLDDSPENDFCDQETDIWWENESQSVWDNDLCDNETSASDYFSDEYGQSVDYGDDWDYESSEQSVWDGGETVPLPDEPSSGSSLPVADAPFEEINQNGTGLFYCWRKNNPSRRTVGTSACLAVSVVMILHHYGFEKDLDTKKKIENIVKFMRGSKKEQQYDGGGSNPPKVFPSYDFIDSNANPKTASFVAAIHQYTKGGFKPFYVAKDKSSGQAYEKLGVEVINGDIEKVKELVKNGRKLIFSTNPGLSGGLNRSGKVIYTEKNGVKGPYMPSGHFVVIYGLNSDGYFTIADPASTYAADQDLDRIKPEKLAGKNFIGIMPA